MEFKITRIKCKTNKTVLKEHYNYCLRTFKYKYNFCFIFNINLKSIITKDKP